MVLIVDDHQPVRDILTYVMTREGYLVVSAESGRSALTLAAAERIDVALIDVHMPEMNGLEVCTRLRDQSELSGRHFPIWLMTGAGNTETERKAVQCGAWGLLRKPFDFVKLKETLEIGFAAPIPPRAESPGSAVAAATDPLSRSLPSWNGLHHVDVGR